MSKGIKPRIFSFSAKFSSGVSFTFRPF